VNDSRPDLFVLKVSPSRRVLIRFARGGFYTAGSQPIGHPGSSSAHAVRAHRGRGRRIGGV
jgi:hypothetical protein